MTLVRQDLLLRRRSLVLWSVAILLLAAMIHAFYPSLNSTSGLEDYWQSLPEEVRALFGSTDITSPEGYLASQWFAMFLPAVLLVLAIGRGAFAVAGEEEGHTLDLLLAQPLTRRSLYLQKAAAVAVTCVVIVVVSWVPLLLMNDLVGYDLAWSQLWAVHVQLMLFLLLFAAGTQAVSAGSGSRALGIATAGSVAFVGYLVDGLGKVVDWLEPFRPLSPWRWYYGDDPLANGLSWASVAVLGGLTVVFLVLGVVLFERRELRA